MSRSPGISAFPGMNDNACQPDREIPASCRADSRRVGHIDRCSYRGRQMDGHRATARRLHFKRPRPPGPRAQPLASPRGNPKSNFLAVGKKAKRRTVDDPDRLRDCFTGNRSAPCSATSATRFRSSIQELTVSRAISAPSIFEAVCTAAVGWPMTGLAGWLAGFRRRRGEPTQE